MWIAVILSWTISLGSIILSGESPEVPCEQKVCLVVADVSYAALHYIESMTSHNKGKTEICRTDVCIEETTHDKDKGIITWPETTLGQRVYHVCPHSLDHAEYAWRECLYDGTGLTVWDGSGNVTDCPGRPLTQLLDELDAALILQENRTDNVTDLLVALTRISRTIHMYRSDPIAEVDIKRVIGTILHIYTVLSETVASIPEVAVNNILEVLDTFMEEDLLASCHSALKDDMLDMRLLDMLQDIPCRISTDKTTEYRYEGLNVKVYVTMFSKNTSDIVKLPWLPGFNLSRTQNSSLEISPKVAIYVEHSPGANITVGVIFLKYAYLVGSTATFYKSPFEQQAPCDLPSTTTTTSTTMSEYELPVDTVDCWQPVLQEGLHHPPVGSLVAVAGKKRTGSGDLVDLNDVASLEIDVVPCPSLHSGDHGCNEMEGTLCSKLQDGSSGEWYAHKCFTVYTGDAIKCFCPGTGAFVLFKNFPPSTTSASPPLTEAVAWQTTGQAHLVDVNYNNTPDVARHVLSGISFCCLLATVAAHSIFRNNRKMRSSQILIHLCFSLMFLTIVLYVSRFLATPITRCVVLTILRYYLVFVSLFWNTSEAVTACKIKIRNFIHKAAVLAWGLPVIMIAITLGIDEHAFHGEYVPDKADTSERPTTCHYRCQLRPTTQYFAYFLPMGTIILSNVVLYARVVVKVFVTRNRPNVVGNGDSYLKDKFVKVIGSITTLVLLSIPWIFSAFASVDQFFYSTLTRRETVYQVFLIILIASITTLVLLSIPWIFRAFASVGQFGHTTLTTRETVYQVIFLVLLNLQGVFLFLFHCVCNAQVRQSWKSVFSETTNSHTGTSGQKQDPSSTRNISTIESVNNS